MKAAQVGQIVHQCTRAYVSTEDEIDTEEIKSVHVHFFLARVNMVSAHAHRAGLVALLKEFPWGIPGVRPLEAGPNYIEVGAALGDQGTALRLFALGHALGFWEVITPRLLGFTDERAAEEAAGMGLVVITGYKP